MSTGQVFLNEIFASFVLLFLVYGVGLDPRQTALVGARLGPLLVGVSLGLLTFATSGVAPGYSGAGMNPARCFAFGIADRDLSSKFVPFRLKWERHNSKWLTPRQSAMDLVVWAGNWGAVAGVFV